MAKENKESKNDLMEKIVSLCKRRGFVYPSSEIYGGFAGFWNYGHYGVILKENIKYLWKQRFIFDREDMFATDTSIISNPKVLENFRIETPVAGFELNLCELFNSIYSK